MLEQTFPKTAPKAAPLFHVEIRKAGRAGSDWQRVATHATRPEALDVPAHGEAIRVYRAERAKPLPAKLAHSIRPSRETGASNSLTIGTMARLMAEHIKRKGLTDIALFPETVADWKRAGRGGVPQSVREFNAALVRELSETYVTPEGWKRAALPERYRLSIVDPREWIGEPLDESAELQAA
jgi:hypothetical protein